MPDLVAADFPHFFQAVYGYPPFAWQAALADRVVNGEPWPEAIDVPTGMGKTAVLDIAVFALAAQADRPADERTAPTRTFMIVDRRLVVDQAHVRACQLQAALVDPNDPITSRVSAGLQQVSGPGGSPLEVVRMRGGTTWKARWVSSPNQPAVVVGTVDQFGSRLLFRGYGVSEHFRPIDAALTGVDALLVLDEAHISRPLVHTLAAVHRYESAAENPILPRRRPGPVLLSATLPAPGADVLRPDPAAETSSEAQARLQASKRVTLVDLRTRGKDPTGDLAAALTAIALDRATGDGLDRVGVVCNTVRLARIVFDGIRRQGEERLDAALLVGRCRELDRTELAATWTTELQATRHRAPRERPVVVVATQTIEVGADFDLDVLISEAAPVDALVQRLGRLNRLGRRQTADAVVVHAAARHDDDRVYGAATSRSWSWLTRVAGMPTPAPVSGVLDATRSGPSVDLGACALATLLGVEERASLAPDGPLTAEVIGPVLEAWARTSPSPQPDQPVHPYLHGLDRGTPEVFVCWRAGLPDPSEAGAKESWEGELAVTPVDASERVSVPIWDVRRFCAGHPPGEIADIEGEDAGDPFEETTPVPGLVVGVDGSLSWRVNDLRPGCTVVVPAERGGHDGWGWTGRSGDGAVTDVADLCRRRPGLRLRPTLLAHLLGGPEEHWRAVVPTPGASVDEDAAADPIGEALATIARPTEWPAPRNAAFIREIATKLLADEGRRKAPVAGRWFVVSARRGAPDLAGDDGPVASSTARRPVGLAKHSVDVATGAYDVAIRLGMPIELARAVELAGEAHDLGKADARFQVMLHEGDRLRAEAWPEPLAKSGMNPADRAAFGRAQRASGLPDGMRHESISTTLLARMAATDPTLVSGLDLDLVLHLVASHHGRARPLLPAVLDEHPIDVRAVLPRSGTEAVVTSDCGLVDWHGPKRFHRLCTRYGWWGLALLEAVVRLADIGCSEGYEVDAS